MIIFSLNPFFYEFALIKNEQKINYLRKPLEFNTKKLIKTDRYQKNQIELIKSQ